MARARARARALAGASPARRAPGGGGGVDEDPSSLGARVYSAFPCPFPPDARAAYAHYTGPHKPWTSYEPANAKFAPWYRELELAGIDPEAAIARGEFAAD